MNGGARLLDRQTADQAYFNRLAQIAAVRTRQTFYLSTGKSCSDKPSRLLW